MPVYHQMGHDSQNLLGDAALTEYAGAVVSPVNYTEEETLGHVERFQSAGSFDFVFDPQLYFPQTNRGVLREWAYFPSDVDTADQSSLEWWRPLVSSIVATARRLGIHSVCSPAIVPRSYSNDYFSILADVGTLLANECEGLVPVQTLLVNLGDLARVQRSYEIASTISRTACRSVYLIFVTDQEPRRELTEAGELAAAMLLISLLEKSGLQVLVGFSSTDIVLWKAAGASSCATGKYFNLRRFTKSRFEEPAGGGGQLPYWIEESLFAFLREPDVIRVREQGLLAETSMRNPIYRPIVDTLDRGAGDAWLGLSWRFYLWWFADFEARLARGEADPRVLLRQAENNWLLLQDREVLFEEPRNSGSWIRPWRQAIADLGRFSV